MDGYSLTQSSRLAQVGQHTLLNWDRSGFLSPSGKSERGRRLYSFCDIVAIRVASQLREAGVSLQGLREVVRYLRDRNDVSTSPTEVLASSVLVTDGRDVFVVEDGSFAFSTLRRPGQRAFHVVMFGELVNEIQSDARALRAA
jgi:DNA-binding transcriptional MerR regulator